MPFGLGKFKGYVPLEDRVCATHNGICSQLDEQLCRSGIEAFFRKYLGLTGRRKHDDVNPFYRGSSRGGALEMVGTSHETGVEKELELVAPDRVRELRCVKFTAEDDSVFTIRIRDGMTQAEFRERVMALGVKYFKHADISAAVEEIPWVESLLEGFKFDKKTEWAQPAGPIMYGPLSVKFTVTDRYFRAIAKIGFHYFLTRFPRFRGDEDCFSGIRNFISRDCPLDEIKNYVTDSGKQFAYQLHVGMRLSAWGHLIAVESDDFGFRAKVQLFVGPESLSRVYTVQIGKNPSPIHYPEAYGDFFFCYPVEDRTQFDGEVSALCTLPAVN